MGLFDSVLKMKAADDTYTPGAPVESAAPQATSEASTKVANLCLATTALSVYTAAIDGNISLEELMEIDINVGKISTKTPISDEVKAEIDKITDNHNIQWTEVVSYLDKLSLEELVDMKESIQNIAGASDGINDAEQKVIDQFNEYFAGRN